MKTPILEAFSLPAPDRARRGGLHAFLEAESRQVLGYLCSARGAALVGLGLVAGCEGGRRDDADPGPPRFYWLAEDPASRRPVLLHTDASSPGHYRVAASWTPVVPEHGDVPRARWTRCFTGKVDLPPPGHASLEAIGLTMRSSDVAVLTLSLDLGGPGGPYVYRCTPAGPLPIVD
jgi:hypothetical protein